MKFLAIFCLLALSSCGLLQKVFNPTRPQKEQNVKPPTRQVIGRIASVSEASKFVLIQKYGPGRLPENVLFQSIGSDGTQASLKPTGERVRDFFAADILTGTAKPGDAVTTFPIMRQAQPKTAPTSPSDNEDEDKKSKPEEKPTS